MDIILQELDKIIKLLEKIEENTRPDPKLTYVWDGTYHIEWPYPDFDNDGPYGITGGAYPFN